MLSKVPYIRKTFRFQWETAQDAYVLLYPEGMIKLNGSAGEIMLCCDGQRSIAEIIKLLEGKFPAATELSTDTLDFFEVAYGKRWIELV